MGCCRQWSNMVRLTLCAALRMHVAMLAGGGRRGGRPASRRAGAWIDRVVELVMSVEQR